MRTAILVSSPYDAQLREKVVAGLEPQRDFLALAEALGATLIAPLQEGPRRLSRLHRAKDIVCAAVSAFRQRHRYDVIIADTDRVGLLLALLFKLSGAPNQEILICHGEIIEPQELRLVRVFKLETRIQRFVCYGPFVADRLKAVLSLNNDRVVTLRHAVDHTFWCPQAGTPEKLIVSAGMSLRDYPTLIEAVRGLDVSLAIAAFSPWTSSRQGQMSTTPLPANVSITHCSYRHLRDLYARALCVAVPLHETGDQSGSLVAYEGMAMGKAVVMTATEGQRHLNIVRPGETGYLVAPGDVKEWRRTVQHLATHPSEALCMGRRARALVEEGLNLHTYVRDMVALARSLKKEERVAAVASLAPKGRR